MAAFTLKTISWLGMHRQCGPVDYYLFSIMFLVTENIKVNREAYVEAVDCKVLMLFTHVETTTGPCSAK